MLRFIEINSTYFNQITKTTILNFPASAPEPRPPVQRHEQNRPAAQHRGRQERAEAAAESVGDEADVQDWHKLDHR